MTPSQLSVLQETLRLLKIARDNFGNIDALLDKLTHTIAIAGVCATAKLDTLKFYCGVDVNSIIRSWPALNGNLTAYPIGGPEEYNLNYRLVWSNPRRLEFINYMIEQLSEIETQSKLEIQGEQNV
ncbi:hypothetical protein [Acinetobacter phage AbTZA1]|uniref:Uncharacterized protein n=1 Tax=Acinetobacter phage AbTZA1 TaxID=2500827 RepID=A0A3Q9R764_9CAUD|nr:hypothetical protein HYP74_gp036 [Acinetobacter phage AbTZA1]AZU98661.1 hypothetical protein [Acinetobacter phage AbTZA1]